MATSDAPQPGTKPTPVVFTDQQNAPIIYFDDVPTLGADSETGMIRMALSTLLDIPASGGHTVPHRTLVAHLRCSTATAKKLRDLLNKATLFTAKTEGHTN
jgi:hypothetical protein